MNNLNSNRRQFLRGLGVTMALPWMESVKTFAATPAGAEAPRRLACVFMGNGVNPHHWGATKKDDGSLELAKSLRPLEPIKDQVNIIKGLWNESTMAGPGGHYPKMNVLSGLTVKRTTTDVETGTTIDQMAAKVAGRETEIASLVLGTEGPRYVTELGYTSLYSSHISWSSPTTPSPKEIYPRLAFDRLFSSSAMVQRDRSILDSVLSDAQSLKGKLSNHDRHKLDEYLTSIRELEERLQRAEERSKVETQGNGWHATVTEANIPRPGEGIPADPEEHMKLMFDLMVLAFQMDKTRVASYMMNDDLSSMNYGFLGDVRGGMHEISHHSKSKEKLDMYQRINEYNVKLWSEALQKMAATDEGGRSLLDNSMVMLLSSLMDGNTHDSRQLPVLLAGGGGGSIKGGQFLDYSGEKKRSLCRLHLSLLDRMSVETERFGDAEVPLNELNV